MKGPMNQRKIAEPLEEECLSYNTNNFSGNGKLEVTYKTAITGLKDIAVAYTPGVSHSMKKILSNREEIFQYTSKGNMIGVLTDGTAVLGWGNIGPEAALPVMEGKAMMFKMLAGVDAFPICVDSTGKEEFIKIAKSISTVFGGYNLEDISAPDCFEIVDRLQSEIDIPIFHDDQHGTATVVLGALNNALHLVGKDIDKVKIVINGAGASGIATGQLLLKAGAKNIVMCDTAGTIFEGRHENMNPYKEQMAKVTNKNKIKGKLMDAACGGDVLLGLSAQGQISPEMVATMNTDSIVFAMANPVPEIMPEQARASGARIVATGRYDFPNQVNNVVGFPGIMRGALDVRAKRITSEMLIAAAEAISSIVKEEELEDDYIVPTPLHPDLYPLVARAVAEAAMKIGIARVQRDPDEIESTVRYITGVIRERFDFFKDILDRPGENKEA